MGNKSSKVPAVQSARTVLARKKILDEAKVEKVVSSSIPMAEIEPNQPPNTGQNFENEMNNDLLKELSKWSVKKTEKQVNYFLYCSVIKYYLQ
jgi:hypothetical protein